VLPSETWTAPLEQRLLLALELLNNVLVLRFEMLLRIKAICLSRNQKRRRHNKYIRNTHMRICMCTSQCTHKPPRSITNLFGWREVYTMRAQGPQELGDTTNKSRGDTTNKSHTSVTHDLSRFGFKCSPALPACRFLQKEFSRADGAEWPLWSLIIM